MPYIGGTNEVKVMVHTPRKEIVPRHERFDIDFEIEFDHPCSLETIDVEVKVLENGRYAAWSAEWEEESESLHTANGYHADCLYEKNTKLEPPCPRTPPKWNFRYKIPLKFNSLRFIDDTEMEYYLIVFAGAAGGAGGKRYVNPPGEGLWGPFRISGAAASIRGAAQRDLQSLDSPPEAPASGAPATGDCL